MKKVYFFPLALMAASCSTLNDSLQLGASMGATTGAAATYSAHRSTGESPSFENVATGAAIGLGVGLLTSYLIHKNTTGSTNKNSSDTEMYFGDLPPSPFVFQNMQKKEARK